MGMFEKIFGRKGQPAVKAAATTFKMLEGYTPAFTDWRGSIYESELIRASLDAWGRHTAKLRPNLKGSAMPELQRKMKVKPNPFQEWSKFLYQTATVLGARNNVFLVPTRNGDDDTKTGVINLVPQSWKMIEFRGEPWIRFELDEGKWRAEKLTDVGIMTRFQYGSELFGESNEAMRPVLDLIGMQRQGIKEGIKNGATYRFSAQSDNWATDDDLGKEMERFNAATFGNKKTSGGVILFPNTYNNVQQLKQEAYKVDADQEKLIKENVFDYFGTNEDILQNKAFGDIWLAFYEGLIEWIAIQLSEVMSGMLFTDRERESYGNQVFFSSNRIQYMSNGDKLEAIKTNADRGLMTRNELREIENLPPLPEPYGSQIPARGEYYDVSNPPEKKVGTAEDQGGNDNAAEDE